MKKLFFLPLICLSTFILSCEKDNSIQESNNSINELHANQENPEIYLLMTAGKSQIGFYGTGDGTDSLDQLPEGGNCTIPKGTCIIKVPVSPEDGYEYREKLELPPLTPPDTLDNPNLIELKDAFIENNLPNLQNNLSIEEIINFRSSMRFNHENQLASWDMPLLRKGTREDFNRTIKEIAFDLTGENMKIIIIDSETNREEIID